MRSALLKVSIISGDLLVTFRVATHKNALCTIFYNASGKADVQFKSSPTRSAIKNIPPIPNRLILQCLQKQVQC
jgi:hypothetical protein